MGGGNERENRGGNKVENRGEKGKGWGGGVHHSTRFLGYKFKLPSLFNGFRNLNKAYRT